MLHGFPDTAHTWDDLRPRSAAAGFRAVSPFMRGYHPSAIPPRDADQETLARGPLALVETLGARDAVLIGHDWGAAAAYGAAAIGPDRVKKLFVIGIPHPAALKPSLKKLWGVRHFAAYKLPGAPKRFARNDFAALPAIYRRWSPDLATRSTGVRRRPGQLLQPGQLERGVRLLPKTLPHPQRITEDANHRTGGCLCRP
ncbi:MAG TPA: alpha/beta hydrolase [Mycobacterium sp.]|nr:alpha/beta hydrolase [Mycobacterium sp.]HTX97520.1 alpha/beta hydrolase [Mycobacterium sp.]